MNVHYPPDDQNSDQWDQDDGDTLEVVLVLHLNKAQGSFSRGLW